MSLGDFSIIGVGGAIHVSHLFSNVQAFIHPTNACLWKFKRQGMCKLKAIMHHSPPTKQTLEQQEQQVVEEQQDQQAASTMFH